MFLSFVVEPDSLRSTTNCRQIERQQSTMRLTKGNNAFTSFTLNS